MKRRDPSSLPSGFQILILIILLSWMAGCSPSVPSPTVFPSATSTLTATATFDIPTLIPSSTPSPVPTVSPTSDYFANAGTLLFTERFSDPSDWVLGQNSYGGTSIQDEEMILVVSKPSTPRYSLLPFEKSGDFLFQAVVRAELCTEGDTYGIMFRVNEGLDHYRFLLDCNGTVLVSRVLSGSSFNILPRTETYAVLHGPLIENHLAVRAENNTFTFYINNIEVFSYRDSTLQGAGFGLVVRTDQNELATIRFDELSIHELLQAGSDSEGMVTPTP